MNNNTTPQKLTFQELINKYKIEIPIIQRDYAQGREGKEEIRKSFLKSLRRAITNNIPIELDFVYGDLRKDTLHPLDGQQRLTTLFLLHWYIAAKEEVLDPMKKELLLKFTYETRTSSFEFCTELIRADVDFNELLDTDFYDKAKSRPKNNQLAKTIENASWFFLSWKKDPTIKSMLTMLDAIHQTFNGETKLWDKLTNISFYFLELNGFGLSDDLYIKMNARGEPLTEFENFKAKLEYHVKSNYWEKDLHPIETFAHKIDTEWTDLFWKYRDNQYKIDDKLLKFLSSIAILQYAINLEIFDNEDEEKLVRKELENKNKGYHVTEDAVKRVRIEKRISELFNDFKAIKPEDFPTLKSFEYLKECFNLYSNEVTSYDKLLPQLNLWNYVSNNKTLFLDSFTSEELTTYKRRTLFYAQTCYLSKCGAEFNIEAYSDWMRVIRNIIENDTVDSASTFIATINLIKELSVGSSFIHYFLTENIIHSRFTNNQVIEEVRKAKMILENREIKNTIFELEDTEFCKGTINWCLECSDSEIKQEQLMKIKRIIDLHFCKNDISNLFRRAMLTIGDNNFYYYWGTWSHKTQTNKRKFIENRNDLKNNFTSGLSFYSYLKPLIIQLYDNDLQSIVDQYIMPKELPNWKIQLIRDPSLLDNYCQGHFLGISNDNTQCFLYGWKKRPASREECEIIA